MPLKNYSTSIPAEKSIQQIMKILASHGAREILMEYDHSGQANGLSWRVETPHGKLPFRLPVNVDAVHRTLNKQWETDNRVRNSQTTEAHARMVAWRTTKDWVDAQMAFLETEQVALNQVFLPYMVTKDGTALYDHMVESGFQIALGPGQDRSG